MRTVNVNFPHETSRDGYRHIPNTMRVCAIINGVYMQNILLR